MNRYRILFIPLIAVTFTLLACEKQSGAPLPKTNRDSVEKKSSEAKSESRESFINEVPGGPSIPYTTAHLSEAANSSTSLHRSDVAWHAMHFAAAG